MQRFGELLDSLVFQPARNEKLRLIVHYLQTAPDPDRGYALAALTGALDLPNAKPAVLRALDCPTAVVGTIVARSPSNANASAPKNPSHVFFGEICGTIGCFPITDPVRYAPMSLNFVTTSSHST